MKFTLIDRITELKPGESITAVKSLSLAEEYLQDHFPLFPLMPGVLMLEAMTQASAWLLRVSDNFRYSMTLLKEARNVKYAGFVEPGRTLVVTSSVFKDDGRQVTFKAEGKLGDKTAVSGRLILERFNLADDGLADANTDRVVVKEVKKLYALLHPSA